VYDDGDEEHMSVNQVKHFLVPDDPRAGPKGTPAATARSPTAAASRPPANALVRAPASAPQSTEASEPQEAASNHAQAAATLASWAPGGGSRAAAAATGSGLISSAALGLQDGTAVPGLADIKPQTVLVDARPRLASQQQGAPPSVPQLPPAGSSLNSATSGGHVPGRVQAPQNSAVAALVAGQAAPEGLRLRLESATPPPGACCVAYRLTKHCPLVSAVADKHEPEHPGHKRSQAEHQSLITSGQAHQCRRRRSVRRQQAQTSFTEAGGAR
jgi:hypothetical protein